MIQTTNILYSLPFFALGTGLDSPALDELEDRARNFKAVDISDHMDLEEAKDLFQKSWNSYVIACKDTIKYILRDSNPLRSQSSGEVDILIAHGKLIAARRTYAVEAALNIFRILSISDSEPEIVIQMVKNLFSPAIIIELKLTQYPLVMKAYLQIRNSITTES
jgi:hypothetical protein